MAKKISVESTSKLPPKTNGFPKSAILSMKPNKNAFANPGLMSGNETVLNTCHLDALNVCAASSIEGDTPSTTPIRTRNAIGVNANVCAINIPGMP